MLAMITDLTDPVPTLAFGMPGAPEMIVLLVLGLLIFGRRLPEVGRSLGRGIVEFKKGIKGIEDEIEDASASGELPAAANPQLADQRGPAASSAAGDGARVSSGDSSQA